MSLTVTATGSSGVGNGVFLQVEVLTNATLAGSPATLTAGSTYNGNITTTAAGSYVLGVMLDWDAPEAQTPESGCTQLSAYEDSTNNSTYAAFRTTSATGTPGSTLVGFTYNAGTHDGYAVAACEIIASGGSIGFDASTPADVANETGTSVTTASFSPPASLLVALVSLANGDGADNTPYTVSMSDTGSLTWTQRAFFNGSVTGNTAAVGVFTAPFSGGGGGGAAATPQPLVVPSLAAIQAATW